MIVTVVNMRMKVLTMTVSGLVTPPPPHFLSKVTGRFKRSWTLPRFINANCYKFENALLVAVKKCTHERNMQYQKQ